MVEMNSIQDRQLTLDSLVPNQRDEIKDRMSYAIAMGVTVQNIMRGITTSDIASTLGVNKITVQRWMRGESSPRAHQIGPLAKILDVPVGFLVDPPPIPAYEVPAGTFEAHGITLVPGEEVFIRREQNKRMRIRGLTG